MPGEWMRRLWYLINRRRLDAALRQEMATHREEMKDPHAFGNLAAHHEDARDTWGWRWLDELGQDLRYTARSLGNHKLFAAGVLFTLALGIGATTAVFSVVSGLVLQPLPFADPDRLVRMGESSALNSRGAVVGSFGTYRERSTSFEALAGCSQGAAYLSDQDPPARVLTVRTEGPFFDVFGVPALRGRTYTPADGPGVAMASEQYWRRRFDGRDSIVGTTLTLDGRSYTIVGVMPDAFQFPYRAGTLLDGSATEARTDLWLPHDPPLSPRGRIGCVTGRLKPGVSIQAANAELAGITARLQAELPTPARGRSVYLEPLSDAVVAPIVRRTLFMLFGAVGLLLALACANVTSLTLARLTLRAREVAVRSALGAGRGRLLRQFVTESLALSFTGGLLGLALAWWAGRELLALAAPELPRSHEVNLDWRVFAFLFSVCAATGVAIGVLPALTVGQRDQQTALQAASARSTMSTAQGRLRDTLVIGEVAIACVLTVGASMLVRELVRLHRTDPGMTTSNVLTFHLGGRFPDNDALVYAIADRVSAVPGVDAAGFTQMLPLQNWGWTSNSSDFFVEGRGPQSPVFPIHLRYVTPGYFDALKIPIERGRGFLATDLREAPPVVLVNRALARRSFGDEDPVGLVTNRGTIVGVVRDFHQADLDQSPFPELYFPIAQNSSQLGELGMTLVVKTSGAPQAFTDRIRAAIREVSPRHAIFAVKTMDEVVADSLSGFTLYLSLLGAFAGLALVLALSGTYSVIAYIASARTREFAIRVALGANPPSVVRLVVRRGVALTAIGLAVGIFAALSMASLTNGLPVQVRPPDLATTVPVVLFIAIVAASASIVPAVRAARVNPMDALRND